MSVKTTYHGWIVVLREVGYVDRFFVEHDDPEVRGDTAPHRVRRPMGSPAEAIEYFDKRAGEPVSLVETPIGAYRVFTVKTITGRDVEANAMRNECQRLVGSIRAVNDRRTAMGNFEKDVEALCNVAEKLAELTK